MSRRLAKHAKEALTVDRHSHSMASCTLCCQDLSERVRARQDREEGSVGSHSVVAR
jgi:hypothetical protein